jgi:hypothetical protein
MSGALSHHCHLAMTNPPIPAITKRAPTIDFIDQRLPKHHPLFATQAAQYDPMSKQYVPGNQVVGANTSNSLVNAGAASTLSSSNNLVQRPEWTDLNAMVFWNGAFGDSMSLFKRTPEPKGRSGSVYDIREKADWNSVYDTLEMARKKYEAGGGPLRKARRKIADRVTPGADAARIGSKVVPQDNIATPVIGAVEIILDAVKTSASVRNQTLGGFDGLIPIFSDVELFLSTFEGDSNIRNASIDLTATTLESVERVIGFFISNEFARAGKAILSGGDYQKDLIDSLEMIQTKSRDLIQQALKSHMFEFHMYSQETRKIQAQLDAKINFVAQGTVQIDSKVDMVVQGTNSIEKLLNDLVNQTDRKIEALRQENDYLRIENGILRSTSPIQPSMWLPPPQLNKGPVPSWYVNQGTLRNMIDAVDVDLVDLTFVQDRKEQLASRDRSRAEQITNTPLFRNWIVSPLSAKLLIHWDSRLPKVVAEVSPLTVFCTTLARSLRSKARFISALWFCGQHINANEHGARSGGQTMVSSLLDQLLRQWEFNTEPLHNHIDFKSLRKGDIETLTGLLGVLLRQIPPEMVLFLIIDGAVLFERDEVEDALPVFSSLIQLVADNTVGASVKLLITSTPGTNIIRGPFETEDLILNVDRLPVLAVASEERMVRELEGGMDNDVY